jgi:hypothetical protein
MTDFDDDDWQDLEKPDAAEQKPDVTVRLSVARGPHGPGKKARAYISLRRKAAEWIRENGPRFRVQIGGASANGVRIVADAARGQYEAAEFKGVMRLSIGVVTSWPNEARDPTEAKWRVTGGGLVLTLPEEFAKAAKASPGTAKAPLAAEKAAPMPPAIAALCEGKRPPPPASPSASVRAIPKHASPPKRRDVGSGLMGDPPPGRSALAQRSQK